MGAELLSRDLKCLWYIGLPTLTEATPGVFPRPQLDVLLEILGLLKSPKLFSVVTWKVMLIPGNSRLVLED